MQTWALLHTITTLVSRRLTRFDPRPRSQNCKLRPDSSGGSVCTVCRDGWYLLDGKCVEKCPPDMASSGISDFRRRCLKPFVCRSGKVYDAAIDGTFSQTLTNRNAPYGCRCPAPGNKVGGNCFACEYRAGGDGSRCLRCSGGKFLHNNACYDECPAGTVPSGPKRADGGIRKYGKECI